jgi:hypothetical protein
MNRGTWLGDFALAGILYGLARALSSEGRTFHEPKTLIIALGLSMAGTMVAQKDQTPPAAAASNGTRSHQGQARPWQDRMIHCLSALLNLSGDQQRRVKAILADSRFQINALVPKPREERRRSIPPLNRIP